MKQVSVILGTRPEAIKLAPVVHTLRATEGLSAELCVTGQHREMLDQTLAAFDLRPDVDFDLMVPNQTLAELTARILTAVDAHLAATTPDLVLVQGDTTTVFAAALAAFYRGVPVGHVEAGLRSGNRRAPFPEETNRTLAGHVTDLHFAPTPAARENLLREGLPADRILVTGNTVIDALLHVRERRRGDDALDPALRGHLDGRPLVLITGHRRESFGDGFERICAAIDTLAQRFPDTAFVYPVHLNPNVREPVDRRLGGRANVHLLPPLGYEPFVALLDRARVVLTDSGGVQEEAPGLGKPVLVMRETTERPEGVAAGTARLVGTDVDKIVRGVSTLLTDDAAHAAMARAVNPYGDGRAATRIVGAIERFLAGQPLANIADAQLSGRR